MAPARVSPSSHARDVSCLITATCAAGIGGASLTGSETAISLLERHIYKPCIFSNLSGNTIDYGFVAPRLLLRAGRGHWEGNLGRIR